MEIIILGGAGFIGTNLAISLAGNPNDKITLVDTYLGYFDRIKRLRLKNISFVESAMDHTTDYGALFRNKDIIFHLMSTTMPATSNDHVPQELMLNAVASSYMMEACVGEKAGRFIFISSGGTVYGKEVSYPANEDTATNPINSYGVQKLTIEKLLGVYHHMHGLDYKIVRLSNPYGPYQRPNGYLGAATTFIYRILFDKPIEIYGDGSIIRDFIYIDDVIKALLNITFCKNPYRVYNIGSGKGTSLNELLAIITRELRKSADIKYLSRRNVDIPVNYLDVSRYEGVFGEISGILLPEGIRRTADFFLNQKES